MSGSLLPIHIHTTRRYIVPSKINPQTTPSHTALFPKGLVAIAFHLSTEIDPLTVHDWVLKMYSVATKLHLKTDKVPLIFLALLFVNQCFIMWRGVKIGGRELKMEENCMQFISPVIGGSQKETLTFERRRKARVVSSLPCSMFQYPILVLFVYDRLLLTTKVPGSDRMRQSRCNDSLIGIVQWLLVCHPCSVVPCWQRRPTRMTTRNDFSLGWASCVVSKSNESSLNDRRHCHPDCTWHNQHMYKRCIFWGFWISLRVPWVMEGEHGRTYWSVNHFRRRGQVRESGMMIQMFGSRGYSINWNSQKVWNNHIYGPHQRHSRKMLAINFPGARWSGSKMACNKLISSSDRRHLRAWRICSSTLAYLFHTCFPCFWPCWLFLLR